MTNLQSIALARSIERHRKDGSEHDSPNRTVLQRVSIMLNAWAELGERS